MLPTKFRFIWPSGFRQFLKKSTNKKQELPVAAMLVNGSEINEQSLLRTFQGCFLPNYDSFGFSGFREDFLEINQSERRIACDGHFC